jgi:hypothetical protein
VWEERLAFHWLNLHKNKQRDKQGLINSQKKRRMSNGDRYKDKDTINIKDDKQA